MSNLFQSFSNRSDITLEIAKDNLYPDQSEASSRTSLPEGSSRDGNSRNSHDDKRPVKRDLLSFMSRKCSGPTDSENSVRNNAISQQQLDVAQSEFRDEAGTQDQQESDVRMGCHTESMPSNACFGEDVMTFLSEEYGTTFQSQLDLTAVLTTTLAPKQVSFQSISRAKSSAIQVSQTLLVPSIQADASKTELEKTILRDCSGSSTIDSHIEGSDLCPDDSESNQEAFNIISAVENFTTASEFEPAGDCEFSKKPKLASKPSKIEFSVSQSASTYHKWKSSVSVPEELVRKLPKPAVQPRLPPELAQSHSGPQVLKSSLNIDFKKQATTKAELRFNSLASEKQSAAASAGVTSASTTEKPPVRLVIKTLSRESKPQRVVIISCSSSVRRDTVYHPNDDSDSDSCGQNPAVYGASHTTPSVSLVVPQESSEKNSESGHANQSGKEQSRSLCFCAIQPTVCLSKIDSVSSCSEKCNKILPLRSFAQSTYESLQGLFCRLCEFKEETDESRKSFSIESQYSSEKGTRPVHDTPNELKRLSDSSGYCAFSRIPDKREAKNIAALYQSSLQALSKNSTKLKSEHLVAETKHLKLQSQRVKHTVHKTQRPFSTGAASSNAEMLTGQRSLVHHTKSLKTIRRRIRAKRRLVFRRLQAAISKQVRQLSVNLEAARPYNKDAYKPTTPTLLDPLVAASLNWSTREPSVDHLGRSSLHVAMGSTDEATLQYVINFYKQKDHLDCKDNDGLTPLFLACRNGNIRGAFLLLAAGASNSMVCPVSGNTPLHEAVLKANLPLVKLLVDFGADITTENKQNRRAIDLSTSEEISMFLANALEAFSSCMPSNIRIIHSDRKLPTIYVLSFPDQPVTSCVIKFELCCSLGVSPEYFDVHYSAKMKSHVMKNSEIISRIVNPHLKETFEVSTKSSSTTTLLEVNDCFSQLFREYNATDDKIPSYVAKLTPSSDLTRNESSSDTEPMTDDSLSDVDEFEIRKDDVKQIHRSIKKLSVLKQHKKNKMQSLSHHSFCNDESTTNADLLCHDLAGSPIRVSEDQGSDMCSAAESGSPPCDMRHLFISTSLSETQAMRIKSEPTSQDDERTNQIGQSSYLSNHALDVQGVGSEPDYFRRESPGVFHGQISPPTNTTESECLAQNIEKGGSPVDINLDLDKAAPRSMLSTYTPFSRRKANPLSGVLKKSVNLSTDDTAPTRSVSVLIKDFSVSTEPRSIRFVAMNSSRGLDSSARFASRVAKSASLSACESRPAPVSEAARKSTSAGINVSGSDLDSSPSVFKVNVLPRRCDSNSTLQFKRDASRSLFSSTKVFRDSKILPPSAMVRILEPALNSRQVPQSAAKVFVASSATESAGTMSSLSSSTITPASLVKCSDEVHLVNDLKGPGSRLFIRGQFRPVRVVVSPSKPESHSGTTFPDPAAPPIEPLG